MLYGEMSAVKDGATDYDILGRWPDSPHYWGFDTWNEVVAYAFGHGLGLTFHNRPAISMTKKAGGYAPTPLKEGMILAVETWTGRRVEEIASIWRKIFLSPRMVTNF